MSRNALKNRIKRIQTHLGVPADGLVGPATLTAIETAILPKEAQSDIAADTILTVSKTGLKQLVQHEISSRAYYQKFLSNPVWPKGQSGITIGIGYDLGYNSVNQIRTDWSGQIDELSVEKLTVVAGLKGTSAQQALSGVKDINVPLEAAEQVFYHSTLPRYAKQTGRAYPGAEQLFPDAQAALLSLVYNRGTSMKGGRRKEMAAIVPLVAEADYKGIADQIVAMKRLWQGSQLAGLLKRRDDEAKLLRNADRIYEPEELVTV